MKTKRKIDKDELLKRMQAIKLTDREEKILLMRYTEGKTLAACGKELGLCRERIRQIEFVALYRLSLISISDPDPAKNSTQSGILVKPGTKP